MVKYRFTTISEVDSIKILQQRDFEEIEAGIKKTLPRGMKFVELKHEKIQSMIDAPTDSISDMVSKLKTK